MGGLTLASENIGALLLNGELPEDRGDYYSINPPIPLSLAVIILLAVLSYFIVFTDPSNLPWITLTGAIYGMVFLYVAEPGPWTNLIVACGMLTPFAIVPLVIFWLIVNKKLRAKYKKLSKDRASRKGSSSSSSGGGSSGGGSGGGFSGGGGSSGGGGASGRW